MVLLQPIQAQIGMLRAEESKVRPKKRIISPGDLKKERRKPGCAFLALDFQRTRPSSIRRKLTASLILEFHRRELGRGSPSRRCHHCWSPSQASVRLAAHLLPLEINRKFQRPKNRAPLHPLQAVPLASRCRVPAESPQSADLPPSPAGWLSAGAAFVALATLAP